MSEVCRVGSEKIVRFLLEHKARVSASPIAIFQAVGRPKYLKELLEHKVNTNAKIESWGKNGPTVRYSFKPLDTLGQATPLHLAARQGCVESTRLLIAAKADPAVTDKYHQTPLQLLKRQITPNCDPRKKEYREMLDLLSTSDS